MKQRTVLWGLAALFLSVCSCSTESALQQLVGLNAAAPVFLGCKIGAEKEMHFQFSVPVRVVSMYFDPPLETEVLDSGETVSIRINSDIPGGEKVTADILVEDEKRNTLNVLIPFRTRNSHIPGFVINEIRTDADLPKLKIEFIELKTTSPGNLGALRLFAAYAKDESPIWEFPPVEVKANEYIVIHTRSREQGLVDETGTNRAASGGSDAKATARDFWIPGDQKILHSTNAIYVMDQDDKILDGVFILDAKPVINDSVTRAVDRMISQGAWDGDPVNVKDTTATRTICRYEARKDSNSAADWYITPTSGETHGGPNK
jgi:hypothetical protein